MIYQFDELLFFAIISMLLLLFG